MTSPDQFARLRTAFAKDPALRVETEWAFRLAVETYNPSDRGLRFISGGIGEWIVTLAAYQAGIVTMPDGHNADGHNTADLLAQNKALWSIKTSYRAKGAFIITNGQGGPGPGLVVATLFLAPGLPGITLGDPDLHRHLVDAQTWHKDNVKIAKDVIKAHAEDHPDCVIPFTMPVNPDAAIRDPGLEAVRLLIDGPQFPRLSKMFQDVATRAKTTVVDQLQRLAKMKSDGLLDDDQYRAAVRRVTDD